MEDNMTQSEIDSCLLELDKRIANLKSEISKSENSKQSQFDKIVSLTIEFSSLNKLYSDYRLLLGFAYFDIEEGERTVIESQMPLIQKRIETIKNELENISLTN